MSISENIETNAQALPEEQVTTPVKPDMVSFVHLFS